MFLLDIYVLYFVVWAFLLWFLSSCYSLFSKKIIKNATSLIVIYKFIMQESKFLHGTFQLPNVVHVSKIKPRVLLLHFSG